VQSKRQIQQILEAEGIRPNKRLGQHFLIDLNLMRLLVDSADLHKNDVVLEVGCGTGSLTDILAEKAGRVVAVDADKKLIKIAEYQLEKYENIDFFASDILDGKNSISNIVINSIRNAREKYEGRLLLVSNLPYNVASPLILNLITGSMRADAMYVTIQKEVADRMIAVPGSKNYGILSVFLAATGTVKMIRRLRPVVFWPRPKVDSTMLSFIFNPEKASRITNMELFSQIVRFFMKYRRKTILACSKLAVGSLKQKVKWPDVFNSCRIDSSLRPAQLFPEDYIAITQYVEKS
jgi:16S rRNA (adenine1518-N6/adenine1519-N6)-dimethyltransferase